LTVQHPQGKLGVLQKLTRKEEEMTEVNFEGWEFGCVTTGKAGVFAYHVVAPNGTTFKRGGKFRTEREAWAAGEALVRAFLANPKSKNVAWWIAPKVVN